MELDYPADEWLPLIFGGGPGSDDYQRILINLMGHPAELATFNELAYVETASDRVNEVELAGLLDDLIEAGILTVVSGSDKEFYGFTDEGKQFVVDSKLYRGHEVLKDVSYQLERTDEIEEDFRTERPDHKPVSKSYEEREKVRDTNVWQEGARRTWAPRLLQIEKSGDEHYVTVWDCDTGRPLAMDSITVDGARDERLSSYDFTEKRQDTGYPEEYSIEFEEEGAGMVQVRVMRDTEEVYDSYIFRDEY